MSSKFSNSFIFASVTIISNVSYSKSIKLELNEDEIVILSISGRFPNSHNVSGEIVDYIVSETQSSSPYSIEYTKEMISNICNSILMLETTDFSTIPKIKSDISLIRASEPMFTDTEDDYLLSQCTTGVINVTVVEGDHMTILDNDALVKIFNEKILKHD